MKHKTDYFSNIDLLKPFKFYLRLLQGLDDYISRRKAAKNW